MKKKEPQPDTVVSTTAENSVKDIAYVRLADAKPNPYRRIEEYHLDRKKIEGLKTSMLNTTFWKTVVGRWNKDAEFEIAFGHHRKQAALEVYGPDYVHGFPVEQFDDLQMLKAMTDENGDDWSNPVEHGLLVVEATRDWLDGYFDVKANADNALRLIHNHFNNLKAGNDLTQIVPPPEVLVFVELYQNGGEALAALRTAVEQGVNAVQVAAFLGERYVIPQKTGKQPNAFVRNAWEQAPTSPKRKRYLDKAEAERRAREAELAAQRAKAVAEQKAKAEAEAKARQEIEDARREQEEAEEAQRQAEQEAEAAQQRADAAKRKADREKAEEERRKAQEKAREEARKAEQAERDRQAAVRQMNAERDAKMRQEAELARIQKEQEKLEQEQKAEQALLDRLAQDGKISMAAVKLCPSWLIARSLRRAVLNPVVQQYLPTENQEGLMRALLDRFGDALTPALVEQEILDRAQAFDKEQHRYLTLQTRATKIMDTVDTGVRQVNRAFEDLERLLQEVKQSGDEQSMQAVTVAVWGKNPDAILRTIDMFRGRAEALTRVGKPTSPSQRTLKIV